MKVFKFGGASVKNAKAVQNVASILKNNGQSQIIVVVSAMGKTTNALERIVDLGQAHKPFALDLDQLKNYHLEAVNDLSLNENALREKLENIFNEIESCATQSGEYDKVYDQVVSLGEVLSTIILNEYLLAAGLNTHWIDARKYISTDSTWREGKVDWSTTAAKALALKDLLKNKIVVTQGFIGATPDGNTTTLGREGSDYSAAIFAQCLAADSVTIWKDVPGVMSADPKRIATATVFEELPYQEAAEMTYYGASVIHPKTIKPLANAKIPLFVKSFDNPALPGTRIHDCKVEKLPPLIVFKENQCLISCKVTDYTFVDEQQLSYIFDALFQHDVSINVMQNSAITFSFCVDFRDSKVMKLISTLSKNFEVYYNTGLTLITIKNYDAVSFSEYRNKKNIMLEQSSRSTLQVLIKN
jgi:aspartate kinase